MASIGQGPWAVGTGITRAATAPQTGASSLRLRPGVGFGREVGKDTPAPPKAEKQPRGFWSRAVETTAKLYFMFLATIGGGFAYNAVVGDGPLPPMKQMDGNDAAWRQRLNARLPYTQQFGAPSDEQHWTNLQPALAIVDEVSPEIGQWVRQQRDSGKLSFSIPDRTLEEALAAYDPLNKSLHIAPAFWQLRIGDQAAVLVHEFRHSRQNMPKSVAIRLTQLITGDILHYPSQIEDEAYDYQLDFYRAIGLRPDEIEFYLTERNLNHIHGHRH